MGRWDLRGHRWARWLLTPLLYFGQRGTALTLVTVGLVWMSWRDRTVEPVLRLGVAVVALLVVVYGFKWGLARNAPVQDLNGVPPRHGQSYPSGHEANAILLWGLLDWAACRRASPFWLRRTVRIGRWIAPIAVVVGMTLLNYHYLSDFAGGAATGVLLLAFALLPQWSLVADRLNRSVSRARQ